MEKDFRTALKLVRLVFPASTLDFVGEITDWSNFVTHWPPYIRP
jgi:hypothetical protein